LPYEKRGGEIRCLSKEIPFDIPESWAWCRLGEICFLQDGEKYQGTPLPYLEAKVLRGLKIPEKRTQGKFVYSNRTIILVDGENSGEVFVTNQNGILGSTYKLLLLLESLNQNYILFIIKFYQKLFRENKKGAAIPHLNKKLFHDLLIGIPPLAEQKRIVEKIEESLPFVEEYGEKEEALKKLNKEFPDALKKSILQWAIQGKLVAQDPNDEPADILLERIRAEKEKLIKEGKIKRDKNVSKIIRRGNEFYEKHSDGTETQLTDLPFDIPASWTWCRLGEISSSNIGLTYKPSDISNTGIPVLRSGNIQNGMLNLHNLIKVSVNPRKSQLVQNNDILICVRNGSKSLVGKSAIIENIHIPMVFGAFMAILRSSFYEYIKIFLDSHLFKRLNGNTKTETINQITQHMLKDTLIPLPPVEEQKRIAAKYHLINELINR